MSNAVILKPGNSLIRIKTNTYELKKCTFDIKGILRGFEVNNERYVFIDKSGYLPNDQSNETTIVIGFVKYESYIDYLNSPNKNTYNYTYIINPIHWFDSKFEAAQKGDIFSIHKLDTSKDALITNNYTRYFVYLSYEFKVYNFNIDFTDTNKYPAIEEDPSKPNYCLKMLDDRTSYMENIFEGHFFKKNLGSKISSIPLSDAAKEVLYVGMVKICWRISNIYKDVLSKLAIKNLSEIENIVKNTIPPTGVDIRSYINDSMPTLSDIDKAIAILMIDWGFRNYDDTLEIFPLETSNDEFYDGYYVPFENYYNTLVNIFINIAFTKEEYLFGVTSNPSNWSPEFTKAQSDLRLEKLISIIPTEAFNFLSLDTKIKILKIFAENPIYESREDAVVKIVQSIRENESTLFLERLQKETYLEDKKIVSLFEKLYNKINDRIIFFGKNNRKDFINTLYILWYKSQLNPYNSLVLGLEATDPTTSQDHYDYYYKNKPIIFNYDSKKVIKFYVDNMNFDFNGQAISVEEEQVVGYTSAPFTGELLPKLDYVHKGDYDMYAAVSLQHFEDDDVAVKMPYIALQPSGNEENYIFPLFYLKYVDDFGDHEDLISAGELALDIALTFTGLGNITKLRHLYHLSSLGRLAMKLATGAAISTTETILIMKGLSAAGTFIKLTSGVAKTILKHYSDNCEMYISKVKASINDVTPDGQIPPNNGTTNYDFCRKIDTFLYWAQAVSTGGESIAEDMLREAAKDLAEIDGGLPSDFPAEAATFIYSIADLEAEFSDFLTSINHLTNVKNTVANFTNARDRYAFMSNFKKKDGTSPIAPNNSSNVIALNNEPDLISIWLNITPSLKKIRSSINFLRARKFIGLPVHNHFVQHVFEGELKPILHQPFWKATGFHFVPGPGNMASPFGKIVDTLRVDKGYKLCKVGVYDTTQTPPVLIRKGSFGPGGIFEYTETGIFRQDWTKSEVLDNLALAYSTKKYVPNLLNPSNPGNQYVGIMSDNTYAVICIDNGENNNNVDYINILTTSWPEI
ncbi:MAG: hypothetical protein J6O88_05140 [Chryseobacterium sp.]|uniref:hypothetical protein n=1 Tax=Chryseobacterium sp. TaxID=1871047 RepID=UPI001B0CEDD7|nr:hypothetical protein [Chryseobacterium sp.]MBO6184068.1 hypothetical protein [Chryseobacterium sp.]